MYKQKNKLWVKVYTSKLCEECCSLKNVLYFKRNTEVFPEKCTLRLKNIDSSGILAPESVVYAILMIS